MLTAEPSPLPPLPQRSITLFLFLFPNVIQFALFSLLAVYYAQVVHKPNWKKKYRRRYKIAHFTVNTFFIVLTATLCVCSKKTFGLSDFEPLVDKIYLAYVGTLDVLLSIMLTVYGAKFDRCLTHQKQLLPRSRKTFKIMNMTLVAVFLIRSLYAFLDGTGLVPRRHKIISLTREHDPVFFGVFIFFFCTECLPLLIIVGLIWKVPKKQAQRLGDGWGGLPTSPRSREYKRFDSGRGSSDTQASEADLSIENLSEVDLYDTLRPLKQSLISKADVSNGVFEDIRRYDSPPQSEEHLTKFSVGSTSTVGSSDERKNFSQIQASFGCDTISPYDILMHYTNRGKYTAGVKRGGGGDGKSLSTSAPRDLHTAAVSGTPAGIARASSYGYKLGGRASASAEATGTSTMHG